MVDDHIHNHTHTNELGDRFVITCIWNI